MIKYKKTLGEASTTIEFETMEQLLKYVRFENEPEELIGVTANDNVDKLGDKFVTRGVILPHNSK